MQRSERARFAHAARAARAAKAIALGLAVAMLAVLAGCGGATTGAAQTTAATTQAAATSAGADAAETTAAPAADSGKPVELRTAWQAGVGRPEILEDLVHKFEAANPNVTFVIETSEAGKYQPKIAMDVAAGNTPDVFTYWRPEPSYGVDKFIEKGALADLGELFDDPQFKDAYPEFAMSTCTVDGVIYALPAEYAFIMFYANGALLSQMGLETPVTYDDFLNCMSVAKENGIIPWAVSTKAFASGWERPLGYSFNRYLSNKGENGTLNAFKGDARFDSPQAIEAANALYALCAGNAAPDAMTLDDTQACEKYFNTGKALFFANGTYAFPAIGDGVRDDLVALRWPDMPNAEFNGPMQDKDLVAVWYAAATSWADPDKKPVIIDFLKFITNDEAADRLFYEANSLVPNTDFTLDPARTHRAMIDAKAIADAGEQVKWPLSFANPENKEPFYSVYTDFWSGNYTGEEFAARLQEIFYAG
ncbi:MAG: extracellular solute-binding protein [Clostridiales bacterium]|nr:extracellular solute-binding protein [Clostridiales bacterium]